MQRCNNIYNHPLYKERLSIISRKEKDRKFCLHDMSHALDVARIGYITIVKDGLDIDKELFYAAALLHDMGRYSGIPHNISGAKLAEEIMPQCGFSKSETELVKTAIEGHRTGTNTDIFSAVLYDADKKSRMCFMCEMQKECYWEQEKRNMEIDI